MKKLFLMMVCILEPLSFGQFPTAPGLTRSVANASSTGTTTNKLTKLTGAPSTAVLAATTDTGGIIGICTSGCGTTGNAFVTQAGAATCVFDGATTAGDYISISSSTAGDCHDAGTSLPSGQVIGRVLSTNGGGGSYAIILFPAPSSAQPIHAFGATFDGGGTALTTSTAYITVPFACTISATNILISPADTATFTTWKIASGTAIPTVANTISTSGISISTGTAIHSTTVSDFTSTAVSANDIVGLHLNAVGGTATWAQFLLECDAP